MKIDRHKYEVHEKLIAELETRFNCNYLFWATNIGEYDDDDNRPCYIFYSKNPDIKLGHTNYFKVYLDGKCLYVSKADPKSTYFGVIIDDTFHFSRYRHDFLELPNGGFIDGGQSYTRSTVCGEIVGFTLKELAKKVYNYG